MGVNTRVLCERVPMCVRASVSVNVSVSTIS